ncbi:hypothetical protein BDZ89DRAFT_1075960 [Hymenopellis radicata]|nr:hypothetical protein BDZ89DRAFT_1075960 [Hymenopellis radicata]
MLVTNPPWFLYSVWDAVSSGATAAALALRASHCLDQRFLNILARPPRILAIPTRTYAHTPSLWARLPADGDLDLAELGFMDAFGHGRDQIGLGT